MSHLPPRRLDAKELQEILEALDPIFGVAPAKPAPVTIDESALPKTWEPPAPPKKPAKEKTLPPHKPADPYAKLPPAAPKEKTLSPRKPAKEKTLPPHKAVPLFAPEDIPAGTPAFSLRRLALFYSPGCELAVARVAGYLDDIGRKVKQPIYVTRVLVEPVTEATHPKAMSLKARVQEAAAAVAVFYGLPKASLDEWEAAMKKDRVRFHCVEPERAGDRAALIEIMSGLLVFDPSAPREYGWEEHGHDDAHGIKREPWR